MCQRSADLDTRSVIGALHNFVGTFTGRYRFACVTEKSWRPRNDERSHLMNWDRIEGNWKQFAGKIKQNWADLTDDDIAQADGKREVLEGRLQARYGYAKDKAKAEVDNWLNTVN